MSFGEVCQHGSLKRSCLICEYEEQLAAADELAEAIRLMINAKQIALNDVWTNGRGPLLKQALTKFEQLRGTK